MLTKEERLEALNALDDLANFTFNINREGKYYKTIYQLIKEHFELVDLIEKWGLNNLSIEELDEWHDRVIWYVQKCDELNDELTKVNDYYFRVEKAIQTLFGVSADDILEIEKGKDKGL